MMFVSILESLDNFEIWIVFEFLWATVFNYVAGS